MWFLLSIPARVQAVPSLVQLDLEHFQGWDTASHACALHAPRDWDPGSRDPFKKNIIEIGHSSSSLAQLLLELSGLFANSHLLKTHKSS